MVSVMERNFKNGGAIGFEYIINVLRYNYTWRVKHAWPLTFTHHPMWHSSFPFLVFVYPSNTLGLSFSICCLQIKYFLFNLSQKNVINYLSINLLLIKLTFGISCKIFLINYYFYIKYRLKLNWLLVSLTVD